VGVIYPFAIVGCLVACWRVCAWLALCCKGNALVYRRERVRVFVSFEGWVQRRASDGVDGFGVESYMSCLGSYDDADPPRPRECLAH
jgi:hypothetical protein